MASKSLERWEGELADALDEIEAAHRAVGGQDRGRRYATEQINHAYAMLLSSHFQAFCRDLHSEAANHLAAAISPPSFSPVAQLLLTQGRELDRGNPNPGNLGSDFGRLGLQFWDKVRAATKGNDQRQKTLDLLSAWRNAIAHQDFEPKKLGGIRSLHLGHVKSWRSACRVLARSFDRVVGDHINVLVRKRPW